MAISNFLLLAKQYIQFCTSAEGQFYSVVIKCGDEIEIMSLIIALSVALIVYNFLVELTSVILNICVICSTSSVK